MRSHSAMARKHWMQMGRISGHFVSLPTSRRKEPFFMLLWECMGMYGMSSVYQLQVPRNKWIMRLYGPGLKNTLKCICGWGCKNSHHSEWRLEENGRLINNSVFMLKQLCLLTLKHPLFNSTRIHTQVFVLFRCKCGVLHKFSQTKDFNKIWDRIVYQKRRISGWKTKMLTIGRACHHQCFKLWNHRKEGKTSVGPSLSNKVLIICKNNTIIGFKWYMTLHYTSQSGLLKQKTAWLQVTCQSSLVAFASKSFLSEQNCSYSLSRHTKHTNVELDIVFQDQAYWACSSARSTWASVTYGRPLPSPVHGQSRICTPPPPSHAFPALLFHSAVAPRRCVPWTERTGNRARDRVLVQRGRRIRLLTGRRANCTDRSTGCCELSQSRIHRLSPAV